MAEPEKTTAAPSAPAAPEPAATEAPSTVPATVPAATEPVAATEKPTETAVAPAPTADAAVPAAETAAATSPDAKKPESEVVEKATTTADPAPAAADSAPVAAAPAPTAAAPAPTAAVPASADAAPAPAAADPATVAAAPAPAAADPATVAAAPAPAAAAPASAEATAPAAAAPAPADAASKAADAVPAPAAAPATPINDLWAAAKAHGHPEIWGVTLADPDTHVPSQIIFQKYLNANDGDLAKAKDQLTKTLDWRAKTQPLELIKKAYSKVKFGGLGFVTTYSAEATADVKGPDAKEVFTWNIYGGVKSIENTFGKLEEFIEWRVALMELAVHDLSIATATEAITAERDPYKIYQVHDYKSISFLRQAPSVKTASKETITIMAANYPELLKEKFFVNVPALMGFMYGVMKLFVAAKTLKKFHPMSNGGALAQELGSSKIKTLGEQLPTQYGGKGPELASAGKQTLLLDD